MAATRHPKHCRHTNIDRNEAPGAMDGPSRVFTCQACDISVMLLQSDLRDWGNAQTFEVLEARFELYVQTLDDCDHVRFGRNHIIEGMEFSGHKCSGCDHEFPSTASQPETEEQRSYAQLSPEQRRVADAMRRSIQNDLSDAMMMGDASARPRGVIRTGLPNAGVQPRRGTEHVSACEHENIFQGLPLDDGLARYNCNDCNFSIHRPPCAGFLTGTPNYRAIQARMHEAQSEEIERISRQLDAPTNREREMRISGDLLPEGEGTRAGLDLMPCEHPRIVQGNEASSGTCLYRFSCDDCSVFVYRPRAGGFVEGSTTYRSIQQALNNVVGEQLEAIRAGFEENKKNDCKHMHLDSRHVFEDGKETVRNRCEDCGEIWLGSTPPIPPSVERCYCRIGEAGELQGHRADRCEFAKIGYRMACAYCNYDGIQVWGEWGKIQKDLFHTHFHSHTKQTVCKGGAKHLRSECDPHSCGVRTHERRIVIDEA